MAIVLEETPGRGFESLGEEECLALLHGNTFGRVAVSVGAIPAVFSVNYRAENGAIYFLTGEGTKLAAATTGTVVAFQIDHFDAQYHQGWSVLAVGEASEVAHPRAGELTKRLGLQPWAPGDRSHLVSIWPDFISGRRISFGSLEPNPWR